MPELVVVELSLARAAAGYSAELRVWQDDEDAWGGGPYPVNLDLEVLRAHDIEPEAYGRALTTALFADANLRSDFSEARTSALNCPLRLRLCIDKSAAELHFLRWELLRDPDDDDTGFLSMHEDILFSRYLRRGRPGKSRSELPEPRQDLRALIAAANPSDLDQKYHLAVVDVVGEQTRARDALLGENGQSGIQIDLLPGTIVGKPPTCTLNALLDQVRGCDILYLACHGRLIGDTPWLVLQGEDGRAERVSGKRLVEGLSGLEEKPRLIVLASCESASSATGEALAALGPRLVLTAGIPAVIAMQGPVSMPTVKKFMPAFFHELLLDGSIDRAIAFARRTVSEQADWSAPVLFMNLFRGQLWRNEPFGPALPDAASQAATQGWVKPRILERPETSFFGRQSELERMKQVAREGANGQAVQVIQIWGAGGTGKTALARQLIESLQDFFSDGQVELDLGIKQPDSTPGHLTAVQAMQALLRAVSTHPDLPVPETIEQLRHVYLERFNDRRVAILLDDVSNPEQALLFLPPPRCCLVLITSSMRMPELPDLWDFKLGQLPQEDAVKMVLALAPRVGILAGLLVEACDRLPQCIFRVGSTLRDRPNLPLEMMLARLQEPNMALKETGIDASFQSTCELLPTELLQSWRKLAVIEGEFDDLTAAAVWGWLTRETPALERLDIWERANQLLAQLLNYGMLEYNQQSQLYALLRLVRAYAITQIPPDEKVQVTALYQVYRAA